MNKWQDSFVDVQDLEELVKEYPSLITKVFPSVFATPGDGWRWKYVWCSEGTNEAMADELAYLLLGMAQDTPDTEYMVNLDEGGYATGYRYAETTHLNNAFVSFGIGCPMSSACSEIWRLVEVNEDGTEKYP